MIDFLERNRLEKLLSEFRRLVVDGGRMTRITAAVTALAIASFTLEALRVNAAWQNAVRSETQRERWSATLANLDKKVRDQSTKRAAFDALIHLRSTNLLQAGNLARMGNAIAPRVGLVSLHRAADGIELEGRALSVGDVAATIGGLQRLERAHKTTFALKRDDSLNGYVWFRLGLQH